MNCEIAIQNVSHVKLTSVIGMQNLKIIICCKKNAKMVLCITFICAPFLLWPVLSGRMPQISLDIEKCSWFDGTVVHDQVVVKYTQGYDSQSLGMTVCEHKTWSASETTVWRAPSKCVLVFLLHCMFSTVLCSLTLMLGLALCQDSGLVSPEALLTSGSTDVHCMFTLSTAVTAAGWPKIKCSVVLSVPRNSCRKIAPCVAVLKSRLGQWTEIYQSIPEHELEWKNFGEKE